MLRKIKYKLLMWLLNDISKHLVERQGRVYMDDIRGPAHVHYMAIKAWNLKKEE